MRLPVSLDKNFSLQGNKKSNLAIALDFVVLRFIFSAIRNLFKSFSNPVSEKIQFKLCMKPMLPSLLFCEFTSEIVCESFYIIVFTQGIIFSSQNKCFMLPGINRMVFDICIIRKI